MGLNPDLSNEDEYSNTKKAARGKSHIDMGAYPLISDFKLASKSSINGTASNLP